MRKRPGAMRKRTLFALGMCAASLLGQVSLSLADQTQSSGAQASGPQSASQRGPQTANPASSPKTQPATPSPRTGKQPSDQKPHATTPSPQAGKQASGTKVQAAPQSPQTGNPTANQKAQAAQNIPPTKQASGLKAQAATPSAQPGKPAIAQKPQATTPSPQTGKQASATKVQAPRPPAIPPGYRLLTLNEGRAIVQGMAWADDEEGLSPDCSHLVHKLYEQAGHPYPYASSLDLYGGTGSFLRVRYAHPGDLVVWRGHVGIVMNPQEHSFFSTTSSGARTANYRSAYWRARGYPHFFRYLTKSSLKAGTGEVSNRPPALQPASQPHAAQPPASQRKDPSQN